MTLFRFEQSDLGLCAKIGLLSKIGKAKIIRAMMQENRSSEFQTRSDTNQSVQQ